ncbi:hypothetical protein EV182_007162 [Spiromyces aspiralis]|uniref:Uncharacterized protein n=1 Tax=Spiromyces aspiralis TaxID=68401 RepID=A0ACC1HLT6_9FUNG|nr:hypothetical protein EV182_007162 [Spiromyces aspiralis]
MLELARVNTHPSLARVSAVSIEVFPTRNGSPAAATPPSSCEKLPDIVELELTATSTASPDITLTVEFHGPIFFGSASDLTDVFSHPTGELGELRYRTMVLDFSNAVIYDSSGVEVIKFILREFGMERGIRVCVVSIDDRSRELLSRSHKLKRVILETFVESASMVPTEVQQAYELLTVSIEDDHGQKAGWFGRASDGRLKSEVQSLLLESTDSGSPGEDGLPVHRADNDARASSAPVISKTGSDPRRRRRDP